MSMHEPTARVVYQNQPYLVILDDERAVRRAHGPFTIGAEPHLADCTVENEVRDTALLETLGGLVPLSPTLPETKDTLAAG
ncbi:MAG TPA: hypothetical protein VM253_06145 [Candidatus Limnocylindrales bacterium]|nr:hypothetical protein [Candidatus Limnocylindrales bacterium]